MTAATFAFLGVVIGALLQYFFTRHLDSLRAWREARTLAYTDYLRSVSERAHRWMRAPDVAALNARIADAKCRVCLYGSAQVVAASAESERLGATMETPEQRTSFTRMGKLMRKDSVGRGEVSPADLEAVLLGVELSE